MLSLQSLTAERWLRQVDQTLDEILIDHAHCERSGTRTNLLFATSIAASCARTGRIVNEELDISDKSSKYRTGEGSSSASFAEQLWRQLNDLVRVRTQRAVDRLLVAGLIEARSCERFDLLRKHVGDPELAAFYDSLFESEARHHSTYIRLARLFDSEANVKTRLQELSALESEIITRGDRPRMHS
jgi:tRNA-(ms[2]io[6]A)-hydroxylase